MKAFLRNLLPWHLRRTLMWARYYHARRKPPFEGVLTQFPPAPAHSAWSSAKWKSANLLHAQKAKRQFLGESAADIPYNPQPSKALLPLLVATLPEYGTRTVRLLDFGGAAGADFAHLSAALGSPDASRIRYHVVDMPECCEAGNAAWENDSRISFASVIPQPPETFDIVVADGAVHMVEDTAALVDAFAALAPEYMLFCKTSMHEGPAFVRRQVNMGRDMENAQWVLGFEAFRKLLEAKGYELTYRGYGEDSYNVDNYPAPFQAGGTVNLLFRKFRHTPHRPA